MTEVWDIEKFRTYKAKKKGQGAKYSSEATESGGRTFHSKKEAFQYGKLKLAERAGEISDLQCQVPFELNPGGTFSYKYLADFVFYYTKTGERCVMDAKGFRTKEYKKKKRLMKRIYNIQIREV